MSEEEIIKKANELLVRVTSGYTWAMVDNVDLVLQGLLDLYNKEKEKNKCIEKIFVVDDLPESVNVCFINSDFFSNYKEIANCENRIKLIDIIQKLLDILKEGE